MVAKVLWVQLSDLMVASAVLTLVEAPSSSGHWHQVESETWKPELWDRGKLDLHH